MKVAARSVACPLTKLEAPVAVPCASLNTRQAPVVKRLPPQIQKQEPRFLGSKGHLASIDVSNHGGRDVSGGVVTAVLEPLRVPVLPWGRASEVKVRTWDPIYDGYENGPSPLTEFLVEYSMVVADLWNINGSVKQALAQRVPNSTSWLRQTAPFLQRVRNLGSVLPMSSSSEPQGSKSSAGQAAGRQHLEEEMHRNSKGLNENRLEDWDGHEEKTSSSAPPGFSFSAAGLLFPYHLGVAQCLLDRGLINDKTPLAGSSAGAIVCAVIAAGVPTKAAMLATKELARNCRQNGTAGRLGMVLREFLEDFLPEDAHERCSGRIRVAVTQLFRWPRGVCVDEFYSKDDLINALVTSSFIPGYLAPQAATVFRNRYCMDGGISLFMPATSSTHTVRVCAFPASAYGLRDVDISPDCNPEGRATFRQLLAWALEPASDAILDDLFQLGYQDTAVWVTEKASGKSLRLSSNGPGGVPLMT